MVTVCVIIRGVSHNAMHPVTGLLNATSIHTELKEKRMRNITLSFFTDRRGR